MAADSTSEILHRNIDRKRIIPIRSLIPPSPRSVSPHDSRAAIILVNNRLQQSLHEYFLVFSSIKDIFVRSVSRTRYLSTTFFHPRYIMLLQRFFFYLLPPLSRQRPPPPPSSFFLFVSARRLIIIYWLGNCSLPRVTSTKAPRFQMTPGDLQTGWVYLITQEARVWKVPGRSFDERYRGVQRHFESVGILEIGTHRRAMPIVLPPKTDISWASSSHRGNNNEKNCFFFPLNLRRLYFRVIICFLRDFYKFL